MPKRKEEKLCLDNNDLDVIRVSLMDSIDLIFKENEDLDANSSLGQFTIKEVQRRYKDYQELLAKIQKHIGVSPRDIRNKNL